MTTPAVKINQLWIDHTIAGVENFEQGDFAGAEKEFSRSLAICREEVANNIAVSNELEERQIQSLCNLSIAIYPFSRFAQSKQLLDQALVLAHIGAHPLLRAGCLSALAALETEYEHFEQAEALLLEAITITEPLHAVYSCELSNNLVNLYTRVPEWRHKLEDAVEKFCRLESVEQDVETIHDMVSGWRRFGPYWDKPGAPNPEALAARVIFYRSAYRHGSLREQREDLLKILSLNEESLAVSPVMVVQCQADLAEIANENGDYAEAMVMTKLALATIEQCYLRDHPATSFYFNKLSRHFLLSGNPAGCLRLLELSENASIKCGEQSVSFLRTRTIKLILQQSAGAQGVTPEQDVEALEQIVEAFSSLFPPGHSLIIHSLNLLSEKLIEINRFERAHQMIDRAAQQSSQNFRPLIVHYDVLVSRCEIFAREGLCDEMRGLISECELYVFSDAALKPEERLEWTNKLSLLCLSSGTLLLADAERIARGGYAFARSLMPQRIELIAKSKSHLGLILVRCGQTNEGMALLNDQTEAIFARSQSTNNADITKQLLELDAHVREARQASLSQNFERAYEIAEGIINQAIPFMPHSSQMLTAAVSIVVEQAVRKNDGATISRLINLFSELPQTFELQVILPRSYKCAASIYAGTRDLRAQAMFESAIRLADEHTAQVPEILDNCLMAYFEFCTQEKMNEKSLLLIQRVCALRKRVHGSESPLYASALASMAMCLMFTDIVLADEASLAAVNIFAMSRNADNLKHYLALITRLLIARKLKYADEVEELEKSLLKIKATFAHEDTEQRIIDGQSHHS